MVVVQKGGAIGSPSDIELVGSHGNPIVIVGEFLKFLAARGCSPNTIRAYAHDLAHLWRFLSATRLDWHRLTPQYALDFVVHLRTVPASGHPRIRGPVLAARSGRRVPGPVLPPATVNRALAAVSSFYSWAITSSQFEGSNPVARSDTRGLPIVADRHRPFLKGIARYLMHSRQLRLRTVRRLPRALSDAQVTALLQALRFRRDVALVRLMLDGGLRPGEALGLRLEDIAYGRQRVTVRYREDHPRGVRSKSRTERTVDLHEAATLAAVNAYVMTERPSDAASPYLFLVGGRGARRREPLSYAALARLFARACTRAGIRQAGISAHTLRHTHATRMWEAGMRELTLQRRLGHASPEATRLYTRVSDATVVAEYRRALGMDAVPVARRVARRRQRR